MKYIFSIFFIILFSGCVTDLFQTQNYTKKTVVEQNKVNKRVASNELNEFESLNKAIYSISDQLFISNINKQKETKIILTSFVDLANLDKTTTFGRIISESMYNELHIRKFNVTDFRGQDAVSVTQEGEFHITRDVEKLKDQIDSIEYILVGTYVKFEGDSILVNARILDSISGKVISTGRVVYKLTDCNMYNMCNKKIVEQEIIHSNYNIELKKDTK
ncbi:MAG: FlgO family outer membrane protein [Campylobacterota bacterium]|nr:FlgO family outer membrane protein [Campylobacterota bacterium]